MAESRKDKANRLSSLNHRAGVRENARSRSGYAPNSPPKDTNRKKTKTAETDIGMVNPAAAAVRRERATAAKPASRGQSKASARNTTKKRPAAPGPKPTAPKKTAATRVFFLAALRAKEP